MSDKYQANGWHEDFGDEPSVEERFHEDQFWFEGDEVVEAEDHLADDVQGDQFPYIPSEDEIPF